MSIGSRRLYGSVVWAVGVANVANGRSVCELELGTSPEPAVRFWAGRTKNPHDGPVRGQWGRPNEHSLFDMDFDKKTWNDA
jgi:hypothetical protein